MKTLIIGYGEIGKGLYKVLKNHHKCTIFDDTQKIPREARLSATSNENFDMMHICIPPVAEFEKKIILLKKLFNPKYTVIHSTYPVGTAKRLKCFHSPVRGIHPHIDSGIKTFVKYLAPKNKVVANYFKKAGINIKQVKDTNITEALKIWDTTVYGVNIMLEKEIFDWCKENKVDFDLVYTDSAKTYNEGYEKLGHPEYKKYILKHMNGGIGGHCVMNNVKFLDTPLVRLLKQANEKYKMSKMSKTSR